MDHTSAPASGIAGEPRWLTAEEQRTWLDLWRALTWVPVRLDQQLKRDAGLSLPEYHVLSQLSEAPDRSVRLSELAAVANVTLSHLSRVADRMARAGWLERSPDPADGRYTRAILTDAGMAKVIQAAPGHVAAVRSVVFDRLGPEQAEAMGVALARIVEGLRPDGM